MSYIVDKNYSVFNNYNYEGKSFVISTLDFLSAPARKICGGRYVDVVSGTANDQPGIIARICLLALSILIYPIGIISTGCLLLKMATFPWFWEKKIVVEQNDRTTELASQILQKPLDEAKKIIKQRPELFNRPDVYNTMYANIESEIMNNGAFYEILPFIKYFNYEDACKLVCGAIEMRITNELENDRYVTSPDEYTQFILSSLKTNSGMKCCKTLLELLKIKESDDVYTAAIKLNIADAVVNLHGSLDMRKVSTPLELAEQQLRARLLRSGFADIHKSFSSYYMFFNSQTYMPEINNELSIIRKLNEILLRVDCLDKILEKVDPAIPNYPWENIKRELNDIKTDLKQTSYYTKNNESEFINSFVKILELRISFIDLLDKNPTKEEIESQEKNIIEHFEALKPSIEKLFETKNSFDTFETFLEVLKLKRKAQYILLMAKLNSQVFKSGVEYAINKIQQVA